MLPFINAFYQCVAKTISNQEIALMFKGLYKVEREHASVFRKVLKPDKNSGIQEIYVDDAGKYLEESFKRENLAIKFYAEALAQSEEPRVKEILAPLGERKRIIWSLIGK